MRTLLTTNATYYVSAAGNDTTGDGSSGNPWATPSKAYDWCQRNLDLGGYSVTVQLLTSLVGTYSMAGPLIGQINDTDFTILGKDTGAWIDPNNFTISSTVAGAQLFRCDDDARFCVRGMTLRSAGFGLVVADGRIAAWDLWFGAMGGAALDVAGGRSMIRGIGNLVALFENSNYFAVAEDHGVIDLNCNIVVSGAPNFASAFVQGDLGGMIDASGAVISPGSATGTRFNAVNNGIVFTGGAGGASFFPGSLSGNVNSGGFYQ